MLVSLISRVIPIFSIIMAQKVSSVEPDETLIPRLTSERQNDVVLNVGVGTKEDEEADFYIFKYPWLNTFSKEEANYRSSFGRFTITHISTVKLILINSIIKSYFDPYPDFLSIDIEGLDLAVLKTLDYSLYPIPVICAETCEYSENHKKKKNKAISEFMTSIGYFVYADTYINTIFVNEAWFNKKV